MNGNAPSPVLAPAPAPSDDQPQPRYYTVRPRHHRVIGAALALALALVGGMALLRVALGDSDDASDTTSSDDAGVILPGDVPGVVESGDAVETEVDAAAEPPATVPAEVEFDIDSVLVVGDSLTEASAPAIEATLAAEGVETVDVHGIARRRIATGNGGKETPLAGIKELDRLLANGADPDVWVIALGTNDVGAYPDAEAYGELIDSVLERIPEDAPLVWVDVYRPRTSEHTALFNDTLHDRLDDRDDAAVAPWHAFASNPDQTILRDDHLHPNARGTEVFAAVITAAIDDALD